MRFSFSNIETFGQCPYKWKLRYLDKLETIPNWDDPANPLIIGSALHHGIEKGVDEAVKEYMMSFPVITDGHLFEAFKLKKLIPKVKALLSDHAEYEVTLADGNSFIGFIDYLDKENGVLLDFKYTTEKNFKDKYLKSPQIHVYSHYLKKLTGYEIPKIGYLHVPKISIRQKKTETVREFWDRLEKELDEAEPKIEFVTYSQRKVDEFITQMENIEKADEFPKCQSKLCDWCDYQGYCQKGEEIMIRLPENKRRAVTGVTHKKIWIYGAPFSGKTTFADHFNEPLMINTDGNTEFCTSPVVEIKDILETEGRIVNTILAWDVFKQTVEELEKGSTFKTIIVDLVEDLYESCRLYMYKQMNITHESDDTFRAWDKVRTEFLSTMRKLTNLPYNIILISHEDMSKDIMKKSGDKITSIRPNINEKVANKLAGMVDIVVRCLVDDGNYRLAFKSDEVVFGGGRINPEKKEIPNNFETFIKVVYGENVTSEVNEIHENVTYEVTETPRKARKKVEEKSVESVESIEPVEDKTVFVPQAFSVNEEPKEEPKVVEVAKAEEPVRRRRRVRSE